MTSVMTHLLSKDAAEVTSVAGDVRSDAEHRVTTANLCSPFAAVRPVFDCALRLFVPPSKCGFTCEPHAMPPPHA